MHDIPPPTFFSDGSLTADLKDVLGPPTQSGSRWLHKCVPAGSKDPCIVAVRVQQGNGDTAYQDLNPTNILITIDLTDISGIAGDIKISGGAELTIDSDEKLKDHGVGSGAKGRRKYSHPGKGGRTFHISRIRITKAASTVFDVTVPIDEEYRVMLWHEPDH
jgi:hypothetical protein